ncbi:recombinase RecT [Skermania piniformis]|uniref:Recombinase RecT n=1 Tax=Skermania pinensis TaxID=39122 RepID=A0ABX8SAH9_9ACTN|nr:recombinase RecT [Skermania piniformis]QXQ14874.1 recombinase RecT [Skermania piniformis]
MTDPTTTTTDVREGATADPAADLLNPQPAAPVPAVREVSSELVIAPGQREFTPRQLAVLRQLGIEDASQEDVDLFFHRCQVTGLDPFSRQIYMIGRNTQVATYEPVNPDEPDGQKRKVVRWVTKYTIQTGIDGYRLNGQRAARKLGHPKPETKAWLWRGTETGWEDAWMGTEPPAAAKVTIVADGVEHTAVCMYAEYVQTVKVDGANRPNSMWSKMPANQIGKCTEAAAWRKAYPDDFADLVLEDAAHVVVDEDGVVQGVDTTPETGQRAPRRGTAGVRDALGITDPPSEAGEKPDNQQPGSSTSTQVRTLGQLLTKEGTPKGEWLTWLSGQVRRDITKPGDLSHAEAAELIQFLQAEQAKDAEKGHS